MNMKQKSHESVFQVISNNSFIPEIFIWKWDENDDLLSSELPDWLNYLMNFVDDEDKCIYTKNDKRWFRRPDNSDCVIEKGDIFVMDYWDEYERYDQYSASSYPKLYTCLDDVIKDYTFLPFDYFVLDEE